jgi:Uma2 family endonuclease
LAGRIKMSVEEYLRLRGKPYYEYIDGYAVPKPGYEETPLVWGHNRSMATVTKMPVEEYLKLTGKPYFEYIDGQVVQKPTPTELHGLIQGILLYWFIKNFPGYLAATEVRCNLTPDDYLIPDVSVRKREPGPPSRYPTKPVHLVVEVLSPDDRLGQTFTKLEKYHDWGVPHGWVIDPEKRTAWTYPKDGVPAPVDTLEAGEIRIVLADIFALLDNPERAQA